MNERIKELATQAGYKDFDYAIIAHKFAELIIKECAEYANWYQANSQYTDIAKAIKEHFGVKE